MEAKTEKKIKIGNVEINSKVVLAPLAGITDFVLRQLIREYAKDSLLITEMISSEALTQVKDTDIVARDDNHTPISYQLSGHKPKMLANSAEYLQKYADMIDINMGCPVNKVVKGTDGCALMRNVDLAKEIVRTVKSQISIPLSVKFRLGYTFDELNFVEYGQAMQESGADFITIHGRTRSQMYGGKADWKKIAELKRNVDIPVFANGDIVSAESALAMLSETGADGIAIGRGAVGNPFIFSEIISAIEGKPYSAPALEERAETALLQLRAAIADKGEGVATAEARKQIALYLKGFRGAAALRTRINTASTYKEVEEAFAIALRDSKDMHQ